MEYRYLEPMQRKASQHMEGISKLPERGTAIVRLAGCKGDYRKEGQPAEKWMKERLGAIMRFRKRSRACTCAAILVSVVLVFGAMLCGFSPLQSSGSKASKVSGSQWDSNDILRRSDQKSFQTKMNWANGYIITLGWNVDKTQYEVIRLYGDKSVCFTQRTAKYADNSAVGEAIRLFLEKQGKIEDKLMPLKDLVLLEAAGPFSETADQLAIQFYEEDDHAYFSSVIRYASAETRIAIMERSYNDNSISYFAITSDDTDPALLSKQKEIAKRAVKDGKTAFFSIAVENLSKEEAAEFAQSAYDAHRIDIFYLVHDELTQEQAGRFADQAYEDGRIEFFNAVSDKLTDTHRAELLERARRDGKKSFEYAL